MLRKPVHFILYLSTLQKPAAGAGFCNVLKYKADTFYLSTIQKLAPEGFFKFVLVSSLRFIWLPMWWVYGHIKCFYSYGVGIDFRRHSDV